MPFEATPEALLVIRQQLLLRGPHRVLMDADGTAYGPIRAARLGVVSEVVLVRNDGWTLGCPRYLLDSARKLWTGSWVAEIDLHGGPDA